MQLVLALSSLFLILLQISSYWAQNIPHIACPQYFQYLGHNDQFIGRITIPIDPNAQDNTLNVEFSQRVPPRSPDFSGSVTLMDNEETIRYNMRNRLPVNYRVDFPTPGVLPKVIEISINDIVICRSTPYPPNSWNLTLSHTLRSQTRPLGVLPQESQRPQRPQQSPAEAPTKRLLTTIRPTIRPTQRPLTLAPATRPTQVASSRPVGSGGLVELNSVCGREAAITSPLLFHGIEVNRGQLPWMVSLFRLIPNGHNFLCGGTLISASTVVSAAHCFRWDNRDVLATQTAVSLGRVTIDWSTPGEQRRVSQILVQPEFTQEAFTDADLALLRLSSPVSFNNYIRPICLWNNNYRLDLPSGYTTYIAGFGTDERGNENTRTAKMTDVDILTPTECRNNLKLPESRNHVTARTLCASNKEGAGPCSGDSGGGLMLQENDVWVLRGVVSAGQKPKNRCDLTQPVIYADVAKHIEWLRNNMWF